VLEEVTRLQGGAKLDRAVQEGALLHRPDGLGLADLRNGHDLDTLFGGKVLDRGSEIGLTVTEV
jgi:hypothetical protein